ncbi:MAG TPA: UDP-N-acetylmuramate:L-alanyl-gamma-D-glutamyl-meso-diaminopimelate ligase [Coxiellaceae bacterium]|nr:UDP-N-acetylmuramate:L-alanyl-gamma-D-glutamyl-meso-diaminopimelate ligase [Coxiellaceae bacterium]
MSHSPSIHILGICGTFMGGLALIARRLGYTVSGSDYNVYPPMSDALEAAGITLQEGYLARHLQPHPNLVVMGNALSRGNEAVEYVLDHNIPFTSGPEFLHQHVLQNKHVIAVAGTHGKTTTTTMITWILEKAGLNPSYLIGGVPKGFDQTARLTESPYFVIEADEYDTAFFDKRPKFLHYHPRTCVINNVEFDHGDIYEDLDQIKKQFHYLVRTVPGYGAIVMNDMDANVRDIMEKGCWSRLIRFSFEKDAQWQAKAINQDGSTFDVWHAGEKVGCIEWSHCGFHNVQNALAALAACFDVKVPVKTAISALNSFPGVKRRLEVLGQKKGVTVYDDFAHHPTAIEHTLNGLRARVGKDRLIAVLQFGSNTMLQGAHRDQIPGALAKADEVVLLNPHGSWSLDEVMKSMQQPAHMYDDVAQIIDYLKSHVKSGDHILVMSNKGFDNLHQRLLEAI